MSENQYCLITGATSGIGKATAKGLIQKGYNLVLIVRDLKRGEKLKKELLTYDTSPEKTITLLQADLSSFKQVRSACEEIKAKFDTLTLLINNAGVFAPRRKITKDNLELTMEVNYFSHFLLTLELLPLLENNGSNSRIVNVSSVGHYKASAFDLNDIIFQKHYSGFEAYRKSKLANILFTYKLAEKLLKKHCSVTVNALHPGVVRTNIARHFPVVGWLWRINPKYISAEKGAQNTIYVATDQNLETTTGKYFSRMKERKTSDQSYNKELQDSLWDISLKITDVNWN